MTTFKNYPVSAVAIQNLVNGLEDRKQWALRLQETNIDRWMIDEFLVDFCARCEAGHLDSEVIDISINEECDLIALAACVGLMLSMTDANILIAQEGSVSEAFATLASR